MDDDSVTAATQRFYDAIARRNPELAFLNYGFVDAPEPGAEMAPGEVASASRRLYDAVLSHFTGADRLLEVGCGRGAGAAFVLESRRVGRYVGLDLSPLHVQLCRSRFERLGYDAHFAVADARKLPVPSGGFDAVFSVEAAQHFEDRDQFYREAARALRPGGRFYFASIWRRSEVESDAALEACGFRLIEHADITPNVVGSLARSSGLRRQIVESLQLPERFTPLLMSWAGVRGFTAFEGLASGELAYQRFLLERASA